MPGELFTSVKKPNISVSESGGKWQVSVQAK